MEQLKYKVFEVLSRTLSVEAFEVWLYADPYVAEHITDDEAIFELVNLNYRSRQILIELDSFFIKYFDKEECLISIVEFNCKLFLEIGSKDAVYKMVNNICLYHSWDDSYALLDWYNSFSMDLELAELGHYSMSELMNNLTLFCKEVIKVLNGADLETRKRILREGIEEPLPSYNNVIDTQPKSQPRKWYQLWK